MINSKTDLKDYLTTDLKVTGKKQIKYKYLPIFDEIAKFKVSLRYHEYFENRFKKSRNLSNFIALKFWKFWHHYFGIKLGFDIPTNVFGKGLNIHHFGSIIVNLNAKIGEYCNIQQGVVIGQNGTSNDVPTLGDNIYIGAGAKIIGKIKIASNIAIGANSVVNKSFSEKGISIAGIPAMKIGLRKNKLY